MSSFQLPKQIQSIDDDKMMKLDEVATLLGFSVENVRRWCRSGKLANLCFGGQYVVIGRDLKNFIYMSRKKSKAERILDGEL